MTFNVNAQIEDPVEWTFSHDSISHDNYILNIKAKIERGWNIYSQFVNPDGPIPTSFMFEDSEDFKLVGVVNEPSPKTKYDPVFQMNLSSFQDEVVFTQEIKLLNKALPTIKGELEFMACNEKMCLPPDYVDMTFDFKKKDKSNLENSLDSSNKSGSNKYKISTVDLENPASDCGEKKTEKSL